MTDENEIAHVRASEAGRGKQSAARLASKIRRLERLLIGALKKGDRELYAELLNDLGQPLGTVDHEKSLQIFDDYQMKR